MPQNTHLLSSAHATLTHSEGRLTIASSRSGKVKHINADAFQIKMSKDQSECHLIQATKVSETQTKVIGSTIHLPTLKVWNDFQGVAIIEPENVVQCFQKNSFMRTFNEFQEIFENTQYQGPKKEFLLVPSLHAEGSAFYASKRWKLMHDTEDTRFHALAIVHEESPAPSEFEQETDHLVVVSTCKETAHQSHLSFACVSSQTDLHIHEEDEVPKFLNTSEMFTVVFPADQFDEAKRTQHFVYSNCSFQEVTAAVETDVPEVVSEVLLKYSLQERLQIIDTASFQTAIQSEVCKEVFSNSEAAHQFCRSILQPSSSSRRL